MSVRPRLRRTHARLRGVINQSITKHKGGTDRCLRFACVSASVCRLFSVALCPFALCPCCAPSRCFSCPRCDHSHQLDLGKSVHDARGGAISKTGRCSVRCFLRPQHHQSDTGDSLAAWDRDGKSVFYFCYNCRFR